MITNDQILERRGKILDYIKDRDCSPLIFKRMMNTGIIKNPRVPVIEPLPKTNSLEELIMEILFFAQNYSSVNSVTDLIETTPGRMRSSFDIWRHAKSVIPDIDIFTIMETMYKMRGELYGHYCGVVRRAVFEKYYPAYHDWKSSLEERSFMCFEYRIGFNSWKKLHID